MKYEQNELMKRRAFMKFGTMMASSSLLVSHKIISIPSIVAVKNYKRTIADDFMITHLQEVKYIGNGKTKYSVLDFHHWLSDKLDDPENMTLETASFRATDLLIEVNELWVIEEEAITHLKDGTLNANGNKYTSIINIEHAPQLLKIKNEI